ncbi:MAG: hypothetical protein HUK09_01645 [Bacteroidaceae bacterium]|nr:hypothetical protein [Bacteroidaceae bacterium]
MATFSKAFKSACYKLWLALLVSCVASCNADSETSEINSTSRSFRSTNDLITLEQTAMCELADGTPATLPWAPVAGTSIPSEIRLDVKESDGWRLLFSSVKIQGYGQPTWFDNGGNLILLYNRYTGVLKGFAYLRNVAPNNNGQWKLRVNKPTTLFNFSREYARPNTIKSSQEVILSNITSNESAGFENGWNCFMTELAYEPNSQSLKLDISSHSVQTSEVSMIGNINIAARGVLSTTVPTANSQSTSTQISRVATFTGDVARNYVASKLKNSTIQPIANVAQLSVTGVVKSLLFRAFSSFFGTTHQDQELNLTATGQINTTGKIVSVNYGQAISISGIFLGEIGEDLGVWNLRETPTCYAESACELYSCEDSWNGTDYYYKYSVSPDYTVDINPALQGNVWVRPFMVHRWGPFRLPKKSRSSSSTLYREGNIGDLIYKDDSLSLYEQNSSYLISLSDPPNSTIGYLTPAYRLDISSHTGHEDIILKMFATIYKEGRVFAYSSKTFETSKSFARNNARPYRWTADELKRNGLWVKRDRSKFR